MLKNKFAIILLTVVMLFCVVIVSGCGNKNLMEDGEYKAVLVAQSSSFSYWPTNWKVEIKHNKLYIEDKKMGKLSEGKVSRENWGDIFFREHLGVPFYYAVAEGVDLDTLMTIEDCIVIDSKTGFWTADYFYLIWNNNQYYLLFAGKSEEGICISMVFLLDEICGEMKHEED